MSIVTWKTGKLIKAPAKNVQITHDSVDRADDPFAIGPAEFP
jgi:hypothetical protein